MAGPCACGPCYPSVVRGGRAGARLETTGSGTHRCPLRLRFSATPRWLRRARWRPSRNHWIRHPSLPPRLRFCAIHLPERQIFCTPRPIATSLSAHVLLPSGVLGFRRRGAHAGPGRRTRPRCPGAGRSPAPSRMEESDEAQSTLLSWRWPPPACLRPVWPPRRPGPRRAATATAPTSRPSASSRRPRTATSTGSTSSTVTRPIKNRRELKKYYDRMVNSNDRPTNNNSLVVNTVFGTRRHLVLPPRRRT